MKFIHLTDPHLVSPGAILNGLDPLARFAEGLRHIAEHHSDAEFCVITGDLADRGQPEAYRALHEALSDFPIKTHLILGNHDHRQNFLDAFPNKQLDENQFVQSVLSHEQGEFLFLDTLDQGQHGGIYCEVRLEWLSRRLSEAGQRNVYLFMHHPPFPIGMPHLDRISMENPEQFAEVVDRFSCVKHLFFGHVHRPVSGSWHGIPFSTLFGTNHQVAADFYSEGVVPYSLEPPAYSVVLMEQDRTVIHTCYYQDQSAWTPQKTAPTTT